jgi:hypothetical protein
MKPINTSPIIPAFSVTFDVTPPNGCKDLPSHVCGVVIAALIKGSCVDEVIMSRQKILVRAKIPDDTEPLVIERHSRKLRQIVRDTLQEFARDDGSRGSLNGPDAQGRYSITYTCSCEKVPAVGQVHEAECVAQIASFAVFNRAKEQAAGWSPAQKELELRAREKQWQGPVAQSKTDPDVVQSTTHSSDHTEDDLKFRARCGHVVHESRISESLKCDYYAQLRVLTGFHLDQFARDKLGLYRNGDIYASDKEADQAYRSRALKALQEGAGSIEWKQTARDRMCSAMAQDLDYAVEHYVGLKRNWRV